MSDYEIIIGLEIHVQLNTQSKMFSGDSNADALEPNVQVSPISLGHPGTLPMINKKAVEYAVLAGLALNSEIAKFTKFDRKHYFYPDLPKGYQTSQFDQPICVGGYLDVYDANKEIFRVNLERIHMEEDSAKNVHMSDATLVDFNRAGSPLVEIVTKPDIHDPKTARLFLQELQTLVRYIGISDADMEKGHMRADANISLRPVGDDALYPKIEVKNLNSFKAVEKALLYEINRQTKLWDKQEAPEVTETRGWDEAEQKTVRQRVKEEAADYRYFPEPDLPPLTLTDEYIDDLRRRMPELPQQRRERFRVEYFLSMYDASVLVNSSDVSNYYEHVISELQGWLYSLDSTEGSNEEIWDINGKKLCRLACNWITSEIFGLLSKSKQPFSALKVTAENLAELMTMVYENKINSSAAQTILKHMFEHGSDPSQVMEEQDLEQMQDEDALGKLCDEAIAMNPAVIEEIKSGKDRKLMFLVGQVMKATNGKANPQMVTDLLRDKIDLK